MCPAMDGAANRRSDQRLLDAIQAFIATYPDPGVERFRDGVADWGSEWVPVAPHYLPAADTLTQALPLAAAGTRTLASLFEKEKASLKWEQDFAKVDAVTDAAMRAGYSSVEIIGECGPFVSSQVRAGIGVWGPNIDYPPHRHPAEEVYVVLAGSAEFLLREGHGAPWAKRTAGDVVYVPSMTNHGIRTRRDPVAVFYMWQ